MFLDEDEDGLLAETSTAAQCRAVNDFLSTLLNFLNPSNDHAICGHYYFPGCTALNWSRLFPSSNEKKKGGGAVAGFKQLIDASCSLDIFPFKEAN